MLTDEEREKLIVALGVSRGDKGFTEEEVERIISWAEETLLNSALLDNVLDGYVSVDVAQDGELMFGITNHGIERVESGPDVTLTPQNNVIQ